MKRWMSAVACAVACAVAVLALSGCASKAVSLGEGDGGKSVSVVRGGTVTVALPSNPSTGYQWVVASSGPLKQAGEAQFEPSQVASGLVGAAGTQTVVLKADAAGKGELKLEYRRPWESGLAEKTWTVSVTVK